MTALVRGYRVLAIIVGVLLAFCSIIVLPLNHLHSWVGIETGPLAQGASLQHFGESASVLWAVHGWVFIIYVVVAFILSRRAGWSPVFTVVALIAGLVPFLIFWVERRVVAKLKAENPELAAA